MSRDTWRVTTHDWSREVDADHLVEARRVAASLGDALALHLALEVIAYADDEGQAMRRRGVVRVVVQGDLVEVVTGDPPAVVAASDLAGDLHVDPDDLVEQRGTLLGRVGPGRLVEETGGLCPAGGACVRGLGRQGLGGPGRTAVVDRSRNMPHQSTPP